MILESKSFNSILREIESSALDIAVNEKDNQQEESEFYPLMDKIECDILMHKDVHFSGKFSLMIEYYEEEGRGCCEDFDIEHIYRLYKIEEENQQNLSSLYLSGSDMERVGRAKNAYQKLKSLFEINSPHAKQPQLLANLIFAEENELNQSMTAVIEQGKSIVPSLIALLKSDSFHDPLYPGYGQAPTYAAYCLGKIGYSQAIIPLFEGIGQGDPYQDDTLISALIELGEESKAFIIQQLQSRPISQDNIRAAMVASGFSEDPVIQSICLNELQTGEVLKNETLLSYLIMPCHELKKESQRLLFRCLTQQENFPSKLKEEVEAIIQSWSI